MTNISKAKVNTVDTLVKSLKGQFFEVTFQKADGSLRTMNGRTDVKKYLKGGDRTYDAKDTIDGDKTIGIWEANSETDNKYRCFKASKVTKIVAQGVTYTFE